jgi:hypothetical protein
MTKNNRKRQPAHSRSELEALYKRFADAKSRVSRNRAAWKLFRLILRSDAPFASLKLSAMPRKNYTWYECATIELFRLGYDFTSNTRFPPIGSDSADDLLYVVGPYEELDASLFAGIVWAAKNRSVDWAFQIFCAQRGGDSKPLDLLMRKTGLIHIKKELLDKKGKLKEPEWMQISETEKHAINLKLTAKIAAMTDEEREARWDELKNGAENYESLLEFTKLLLGGDAGLADD